MRLFVAINLPEPVKKYVLSLQKLFADIGSFSFVQDCHLTLKFLGEVSPAKAEKVRTKLSAVTPTQFALTLDKFGIFPSEEFARVLWVGVKPVEPVAALAEQIDATLQPLFPKEDQFHPHLTIARIKSIADKEKFLKTVHETRIDQKKFAVENFKLVQSILQGGKPPKYVILQKYPLK